MSIRRKTTLFAIVLSSWLGTSTAYGQSERFGADLGTICLSFSATEHVSQADFGAFDQFQFYLLVRVDFGELGLEGHNSYNGMWAWEAEVFSPGELTILGREILPATSLNVGIGSEDNFVVGTGAVYNVSNEHTTLVRYTGLIVQEGAVDLVLSIGGATPSTFDGVPGWLEARPTGECTGTEGRCLRRFADWESELIVNCESLDECPVSTTSASWGAVKSAY